jgi:ribosomal protein L21E
MAIVRMRNKMTNFNVGDKVQILQPEKYRGAKGVVTSVTKNGYGVNITQVGPYSTVKYIGNTIGCLHGEIKGI